MKLLYFFKISFTVSYNRYPAKQADGCNLCRSTVFFGQSAAQATRVNEQAIHILFTRENNEDRASVKTLLQFLTVAWHKASKEPWLDNQVSEAPAGILCKFSYFSCVSIYL